MIDLFKRCGVARRADDEEFRVALAVLADDGRGERAAIADVLEDASGRARYERLHLQCRAIAAASGALDRTGAIDTHRWRDRLSDFMDVDEGVPARDVRTGPMGDAGTARRAARSG